jgi:hypothetical protein
MRLDRPAGLAVGYGLRFSFRQPLRRFGEPRLLLAQRLGPVGGERSFTGGLPPAIDWDTEEIYSILRLVYKGMKEVFLHKNNMS